MNPLDLLLEQSKIVVLMAGFLVTLLTAIVGFLVGWLLRHDRKLDEHSACLSIVDERSKNSEEYLVRNVPEAWRQVDKRTDMLVETLKNVIVARGV